MKTFATFVVAGGMLFSAHVTFAQRDAGSKMDGQAYEINIPSPPTANNWTYEVQEAQQAPAQTVKTGAVEGQDENDRDQNNDADKNAEPKN